MTKKRAVSLLLAAAALLSTFLLPACGNLNVLFSKIKPAAKIDDPWAPEQTQPDKTYTYGSFDDNEREQLVQISDVHGATAVQLAVLDGDKITTFSYGLADRAQARAVTDDTKYRVASLSKLAAAMTFMAAQDRGLVNEDADISAYYGETCRSPYYPDVAITPGMLMAHTAGFPIEGPYSYYSGMFSVPGIYQYTEPGKVYNYSNFGYGILSCLMEIAADRSFNSMAQEYLFQPLEIDASYRLDELEDASDIGLLYGEDGGLDLEDLRRLSVDAPKQDLTLACGNLIITAKDYVKLLGVMMHSGLNINGQQILTPDSVNAMLQLRISQENYGVAYGSQIQTNVISGQTVYVHTGSAYGMYSAYVFEPTSKKAVAVFTTGEPRNADPESEVYYLCQDLIRAVWNAQSIAPTSQAELPSEGDLSGTQPAAASSATASPAETVSGTDAATQPETTAGTPTPQQ